MHLRSLALISLLCAATPVLAGYKYDPYDRAYCVSDAEQPRFRGRRGFDFIVPGSRVQVVDRDCRPLRDARIITRFEVGESRHYPGSCSAGIGLFPLPGLNRVIPWLSFSCSSSHDSESRAPFPTALSATTDADLDGGYTIPSARVTGDKNHFHPSMIVEVIHVGHSKLRCAWRFDGVDAISSMSKRLICQDHRDPDPLALSRIERVTSCSSWIPPFRAKPALQYTEDCNPVSL